MTDWYDEAKEKWREALVAQGHAPQLDKNGKLDAFALDYDSHNGPACESCDESWCWHCSKPSDIEPCCNPVVELRATEIKGRLT